MHCKYCGKYAPNSILSFEPEFHYDGCVMKALIKAENPNVCQRLGCSSQPCGGMLVDDVIYDPRSFDWEYNSKVKRCVSCGDITDPTILKHRSGIFSA